MRNARGLKKKGFTLVEILVVLGIIGMVVFISVGSYGLVRKKIQLDITANTVESIITEAREKTRAGYYEPGAEITNAQSVCFGFRANPNGFIELMRTKYDRLKLGEKCSRLPQDITMLRIGDSDSKVIIKELYSFGNEASDPVEIFFKPPDAEVEMTGVAQITDANSEIRIVIGYEQDEGDINKREIFFNVLAGNVYSQKYNAEENEQN